MKVVRHALVAALVATTVAHAQAAQQTSQVSMPAAKASGRIITSTDIKAWNSIRNATLSNDGKWFAYVIGTAEGDGTLYLKSTTDPSKEIKWSVGGTGGGTFTL